MKRLNPSTVAIIPARGGSVGIPRKNVRLINGIPLIAYSIKNCLNSKTIDRVFVSTEDPEIAEVAKRFGANVLERPVELADSTTTLDEVIVSASRQLAAKKMQVDYMVTIQATSPLLKSETIDRAVTKCIKQDFDTVLSVTNSPNLSWEYSDDKELIPSYEKRLNRQDLPARFQETGGVVVCSSQTLSMGTRFGKKIGIIELNKAEAIDVDDYFDWWLIEKSLQRKRICFHVTGNKISGLGHVYRALTLADRLIDHDLWFLVNENSAMAEEMIKERFYPVRIVTPGEEIDTIIKENPDLLINDILDTEINYMKRLAKSKIPSINFEDLGEGSSHANYVINSMYENKEKRDDRNIFFGSKYCCLRDEFYSTNVVENRGKVKNILLLFGGTDPSGLTLRTLQWLDQIEGDWNITTILGIGYSKTEKVISFSKESNHEINIVCGTNIISRYMAEADFAITSAGRTVYELGSVEVPVISIAVNDREMTHDFVKNSPGVIFLGNVRELTQERFTVVVSQLINSDILREKMRKNLQSCDIREGINNVLGIIHKALKSPIAFFESK